MSNDNDEQEWAEITLGDLSDLPKGEQAECRVRIGGITRQVVRAGSIAWKVTTVTGEGEEVEWTRKELEHWGAVIERPSSVSTLPKPLGSVILVDGYVAQRRDDSCLPWLHGDIWRTEKEMQDRAAEFGMNVLVPGNATEVEAARA